LNPNFSQIFSFECIRSDQIVVFFSYFLFLNLPIVFAGSEDEIDSSPSGVDGVLKFSMVRVFNTLIIFSNLKEMKLSNMYAYF